MKLFASALLLLSPTALADDHGSTCAATASTASHTGSDIVETALAAGSFNTLATALKAADLVEALQGEGPFTVFAPTDDAFAALPEATLANLLKPENKALLQSILKYHVVAGAVPARKVVKLDHATTLNGQRLDVIVSEDGVRVDSANVIKTDIECSNGIIHVIDRVILPSTKDIIATAVEAGSFSTLAAALKAAGLVEALQGDGPFTVFAPTDEAFAKLPKGTVESLLKPENKAKLTAVLTYHVVPGRVFSETAAQGVEAATLQGQKIRTKSSDKGVFINHARVLQADIQTTNGVIHVIDTVLLPE